MARPSRGSDKKVKWRSLVSRSRRKNSAPNKYFRIKRDFLRHKTVKTNDKIRRFGEVMTPLSRKKKFLIKSQHLKRCGAKINITGCENYENTFVRIESDCTLRCGFNLMKSISYTKQSNLFLHSLSTSKRFSR